MRVKCVANSLSLSLSLYSTCQGRSLCRRLDHCIILLTSSSTAFSRSHLLPTITVCGISANRYSLSNHFSTCPKLSWNVRQSFALHDPMTASLFLVLCTCTRIHTFQCLYPLWIIEAGMGISILVFQAKVLVTYRSIIVLTWSTTGMNFDMPISPSCIEFRIVIE